MFIFQLLTHKVSHESQVWTVSFLNCRQIGNFLVAGGQTVQQQRCPHGKINNKKILRVGSLDAKIVAAGVS